MNWHAIEPLDVLFLRGNKLFGDPGSYGEALVPPWPSVAAGAIRSAILARDGVDFGAFGDGQVAHETLGTPSAPGAFRLTAFHLAQWADGRWQALHAPAADLVIAKTDEDGITVHRLEPQAVANGIQGSIPTGQLPVMAQPERAKPDRGWWLTEAGYRIYLDGGTPEPPEKGEKKNHHMIHSNRLWQMDERVGVGLDTARRRADDGKLFTVQAVAFRVGVGFLAATEGDALGEETLLRLGGDGRGATLRAVDHRPPEPDLEAIASAGRCRIVLTSPGIFPEGWRLPGMDGDGRFELGGVRGRVVSACVSRAETMSGWDLAARRPKPAQRTAPTGSVYWLEDLKASPEALRKLVNHGLWPEPGYDSQRRAEGFNRFTFATY
ncbi:type III-B CRISPR module-associated protein Cmr3 [Thiohalobacter sp. IOR34]|uniref:type III-B CRISPR module-associated protein Cmr3 n=1 Tax=Thiohalobacter sp. IOR34 TaxID=3057176 RepID=UPI0025AF1EB1|nr:type III-B CRISPR module-associated protein Cmr3 [Thiohalobacter sp. IOR34]WJW76669.1 type III-B CRISPR module-associated protein Cmr3 [Thiohalobacter sp. IOR34]